MTRIGPAIAPLVPAEVDLRGMPWMPLDTVRLIDSDLFALSTGDEFKAAVALWCKSWAQLPAASLPSDDRILAHLSGAGARWKKVKAMALRGWVQCDDGRLYHPVIAEKALEAWEQREEYQDRQDNEKTRLQQFRAEHKALRKTLREHGIVLPFDTKIDVLRERVASLTETKPETPPETIPETQPETKTFQDGNACNAPAMAKTGTGTGTGTGTEIKKSESGARASDAASEVSEIVVTDIHGAPVTSPIAELTAEQSAVVVKACVALRKMGASPRFHVGDLLLAALAMEGFTAEQLVRCAGEKALRDAGLWNDPDVHPDLFDLLVNGASQQQMGLTPTQYAALRSAMSQVSIGYLAGALRGRRRDAANPSQQGNTGRRGATGRPSAADNFKGKTYAGTAIDQLPAEYRDALERAGIGT